MAKLIFFDDSHRYTVDGVDVPSVSELTRFISRELYGEVQQYLLDNAASRGTKIHKAAEALDKYGSVEIEDDLAPYLKAYVAFLKDHKPQWDKIEWSVCNGTLYAGTIDRYGELGSKKAIVDLKSTANITGGHKALYTAAQNLYRMAAEKEVPVEALYILQLRKDGTYRLIELPIEDELANACIALHEAMKKKPRKRKEKTE